MALFSSAGSRLAAAVPASAAAAAPWIQWLARFGYAARGVVYLLVGFIALQAAFSSARQPEEGWFARSQVAPPMRGRTGSTPRSPRTTAHRPALRTRR